MKTQKELYIEWFADGWYIEESVNENRNVKDVKLWTMKKDRGDGRSSIKYYFSYDVAIKLRNECGATIIKKDKIVNWLNDCPLRFKPQRGCKIQEIFN